MAKKIFDILPPTKLEKKEAAKKPEIKISPPLFKKKLFFIFLVLILIGILGYFILPHFFGKAEIEIWPETEIKTFETKLTVDIRAKNTDLLANLIPGTSFEEKRTFSQEFPASGKKLIEGTAKGVIRVYNNYHFHQSLVKYTRFQPPLEKVLYFCTEEDIDIPAKSERDVKVFACKEGGRYAPAPGEEYNIGPSTFAVPGLVGTPQYTFIYGKSFEPMKGGLKKEVPQVTEEDLKEAERFLKEKALKEIKGALRSKIPTEFVCLEEQILSETLETFPLAKAGAELEKFTFQVKAKAKTIVFKKEDLENFSKEFIISQIPADKKIDQKSLKLESLPETINLEAGKIILSLNLEAKIYSALDEVSLKQALAEKRLAESQFFLRNQSEIKQAKVKLWPFWLKKVPENLEKIKIKEVID